MKYYVCSIKNDVVVNVLFVGDMFDYFFIQIHIDYLSFLLLALIYVKKMIHFISVNVQKINSFAMIFTNDYDKIRQNLRFAIIINVVANNSEEYFLIYE